AFAGAQADVNRSVFRRDLAGWIRTGMPEIHARLWAGGSIADIGCGTGWSTVALGSAYPAATVDGYDIDGASATVARTRVAAAGLTPRVRIHDADCARLNSDVAGRYDLVCV